MTSLSFSGIAAVAQKQGWHVERTTKGHRRLIPPDKNKRIVIAAGTPGDQRAVKDFLADMKLNGFQWPWPPPKRRSSGSCGVKTIQKKKEKDMAVKEAAFDDAELANASWIPVVADKPIEPGYVMNIDGVIHTPLGRMLTPERKGRQLWVVFKLANSAIRKRLRLDKVVLWTWVGEPVDPNVHPMHINGDPEDCRPDNLRWPCDVKSLSDSPSAVAEPVDIAGSDPVRQPRQPDVVDVDDVSLKFVLGNHGVELTGAFTSESGFYSIVTSGGRIDGLSSDDLKVLAGIGDDLPVLAGIVARWRKVADQLTDLIQL